jgi:hypothetical protein
VGPVIFRRAVLLLPALTLASLVGLAPGSTTTSTCAAAGPHHAALVVEHGDGSVVTRCVAFDTSQVTGEQLLNASGISWSGQTFGGFGSALCAVDGEPAHYSTCPGKDNYWAVFVARAGGAWQLSSVGITTLTLADGDAEGLRYVPSSGNPVAPPIPVGICSAATPAATAGAIAASGITAVPVATGRQTAATTVATASAPDVAAATAAATASATATVSAPAVSAAASTGSAAPSGAPGNADRAPDTSGGLDLGLLIVAVGGGGLAGLALLRLIAGRRPVP